MMETAMKQVVVGKVMLVTATGTREEEEEDHQRFSFLWGLPVICQLSEE